MKLFMLAATLILASFSSLATQASVTPSSSFKAVALMNTTSLKDVCDICAYVACTDCMDFSDVMMDDVNSDLIFIKRR